MQRTKTLAFLSVSLILPNHFLKHNLADRRIGGGQETTVTYDEVTDFAERLFMRISALLIQQRLPSAGSLCTLQENILVSIVFGLVGTFDGYTNICCLFGREYCEFYPQLLKM